MLVRKQHFFLHNAKNIQMFNKVSIIGNQDTLLNMNLEELDGCLLVTH